MILKMVDLARLDGKNKNNNDWKLRIEKTIFKETRFTVIQKYKF